MARYEFSIEGATGWLIVTDTTPPTGGNPIIAAVPQAICDIDVESSYASEPTCKIHKQELDRKHSEFIVVDLPLADCQPQGGSAFDATTWLAWAKDNLGPIAGSGGTSPLPAGAATEATLIQVLNSIVSSQDIEILLVRDTGNSNQVVQQIREYDQGTGVWSTRYEDVSGSAYVPVGPLEYLDPSAVLNLVLSELIALNTTDFATETTLADILSDTTSIDGKVATEVTLAALLTAFNSEDFATETTLSQLDSNVALGNLTLNNLLTAFNAENFAQETTLALLAATDFATETTLAGIAADITTLTGIDYATETTLTALNAKFNTLGQKLSAGSHPVVLSTEQEAILSLIESAVSGLDTSALATEVTLQSAATLLTAIDIVLGQIKTDTANLDVALSTLATESTLSAIETLLTSIDGKDFATQTTLAGLLAEYSGSNVITRVNISGNAAYAVPGGTYTSIQLIVTSGTVSDGTITYPEGVFNENAKLNKTLNGVTFDASGATAFVKLML